MILGVLVLGRALAADSIPEVAVDGQIYRPPIGAQATLWADDSHVGKGALAGASVGWVHEPVVWVWEDTGERVPLVGDAVGIDVLGGYSFWRIRAAVDVPVYPVASSASGEGGAGLGDIAVDLKGMILDKKTAPLGLGIAVRADLPTASTAAPLAADGLAWEATIIADKQLGPVLLAANVGTRGMPAVEVSDLSVSDQLAWRVGGAFDPGASWGLSLDLAGYATWADLSNPAGAPAEAMIGGFYRVGDSLKLAAGYGHGISSGIGASNGRAVLSVGWQQAPAEEKPRPVAVATVEPRPEPKPEPKPEPVIQKPVPPAVVSPPPAPVPTAQSPVVVSGTRILTYQRIAFDGATLRPEGAAQVDQLAKYLLAHPEIESVRIEGHTDGRGDPSDELALAGTRAGVVLERLVAAGLDRKRFYAAGYGGMRPVDQSGTEAARVVNERIDFVVTRWAEGFEPK